MWGHVYMPAQEWSSSFPLTALPIELIPEVAKWLSYREASYLAYQSRKMKNALNHAFFSRNFLMPIPAELKEIKKTALQSLNKLNAQENKISISQNYNNDDAYNDSLHRRTCLKHIILNDKLPLDIRLIATYYLANSFALIRENLGEGYFKIQSFLNKEFGSAHLNVLCTNLETFIVDSYVDHYATNTQTVDTTSTYWSATLKDFTLPEKQEKIASKNCLVM